MKWVCIVFYGINDFFEDIMKKCIVGGVFKINVNKLVLDDYFVYI